VTSSSEHVDKFDRWFAALEERHLADLRPAEVNRALRALSDDYVHRRHRVGADALAGRGKRAAFALFYGPLHYLVVRAVARELSLSRSALSQVVDLGCGTGAAGAAVASALTSAPHVLGIDRQGWTLEEAAFTYRHFGLAHRIIRSDARVLQVRRPSDTLVLAAYVVNELDNAARDVLLESLMVAAKAGAALLVVEPIARSIAPWWNGWSAALRELDVREDEWRFSDPLPQALRRMDRAAGLDHAQRKARTFWIPPRAARSATLKDRSG
jgi:SAM-dependent methyltransferase